MRYQELLFSASVFGAATALHNCRHPGEYALRIVDFPARILRAFPRAARPTSAGPGHTLTRLSDSLPADGVDAMLCPQFARHFCKLLRISSTLLLPENKKPGGAGWHRRTIVRSVLSITLQLFARAAALEPTSACESSIAHSHESQRTSK